MPEEVSSGCSWISDKDERSWIQKLSANVLRSGPLPRHVGFILDGNRRFAVRCSVPKIQGHIRGFEKLAETLRWCLDLGIREVTVFVFSIENFKRSPEEVEGLLKLAQDKFMQLLSEENRLREEGVCVEIVGDWSLVPQSLRPLMTQAMLSTRHNQRAKLNVAFAYTARNEMARGVAAMEKAVMDGHLLPSDLNEDLLGETFQRMPTLPLDLLVRTSGETRLSDFLLWQSAESVVCYTKVLWPEFSYWHLLGAIFHYQVNHMAMFQIPQKQRAKPKEGVETRRRVFIDQLWQESWEGLKGEAPQSLHLDLNQKVSPLAHDI